VPLALSPVRHPLAPPANPQRHVSHRRERPIQIEAVEVDIAYYRPQFCLQLLPERVQPGGRDVHGRVPWHRELLPNQLDHVGVGRLQAQLTDRVIHVVEVADRDLAS